ncbi:MAG: hypothetical protein HXY26_01595 [Hydrogenophilaceae bacterium]|nr:hypothetical protein [Hydrogenophilaceae bacterium]
MKRAFFAAAAMLTGLHGLEAKAANWVDVIAAEQPESPTIRPFGFVQPTYTYYSADRIQGASAALNGNYQLQNLVGPNFDDPQQFQLLRAQVGVRGILHPVSDKISYMIFTDFGRNIVTQQRPLMLTEAVATFNHIPGARIRAGLFKPPTGEEALVVNPIAFSYVYYSFFSSVLLQEFPYRPSSGSGCGATAPAPGYATTLTCARVAAGNMGYRDWGIQVFDSLNSGNWELGYAAMVSNGGELENMVTDTDGNKDLTWRLQLSYIFDGKGPFRNDVNAFLWRQEGDRRFGADDYSRTREGTGFRYFNKPFRFSGEYIRGEGMIPAGPNPPLAGPTGLSPTYNLLISPTAKADGWYLEGGWRFHRNWEVSARYDEFDVLNDDPFANRLFKTWTLSTQYFLNKNTQILLNYEWRDVKVPHLEAIAAAQQANALALANNLADRISLQLTWHFF